MGLLTTEGHYIKVEPQNCNIGGNNVVFRRYKSQASRTFEKSNGALPAFEMTSQENTFCPTLQDEIKASPEVDKSIVDNLTTALYSALKVQHPDWTDEI